MMNLPEYVDEDEVKTMFGCADKVSLGLVFWCDEKSSNGQEGRIPPSYYNGGC